MKKSFVVGLAAASALFLQTLCAHGQFASAVIDYNPGTGAGLFNNPATALGAPTSLLDYGPVDPFNAPYSTNDVVTIGTGGSLTVRLDTPIRNDPGHLFGTDFLVFGNAGFVITNDFDPETFGWIGEPATDGSLYGASAGAMRVSVSENAVDFYLLDPLLAPTLDALFPGDAAGDFRTPVNPALSNGSFAGLDLAGIRGLYNNSAGGAGFDLGWARDEFNQSILLTEAWYVRVEALSDDVEIDAFTVVPEPGTFALLGWGAITLAWARTRFRS
jgi:hypothetical protein